MSSDWLYVRRSVLKGAAIIRAMFGGAILIGSVALAADAEAAPVSTYNFTQDGYIFITAGSPQGVLTGSFSGTPDSSGTFGLSNLTAFSWTFTVGSTQLFTSNVLSHVTLFSYDPANASSFDVIDTEPGLGSVCVGPAAAFGFCGGTGALGAIGAPPFAFANWSTANGAVVTLTSVTSVTPISPTLPLFATSLAALGLARRRRRRSSAA